MKILLVTNMWPDERRQYYGNYVRDQVESLWRLGLEVDVLYLRGFLTQSAYFSTFPELRSRVRDRTYDLIHAHYGHTAAVTAATLRRPLVITYHGHDLMGAPSERGMTLKSRLEVAAFRQLPYLADATITQSREMEASLPPRLRARNHIVPCGIDTERFAPRPQGEARRALGWDENEKVVLFVGDPDNIGKRFELARQAVQLVREQQVDVRLEVAFGHPPEDVPRMLNAADCLVFPSRQEGSPVAVKEAMASELPVVATPVGDVPERLSGVEGCFVRRPVPADFAEAILAALDHGRSPAAREAAVRSPYGARGLEDLDGIARRLQDVYSSVL